MPTPTDLHFGRLAVKHKIVAEDKIKECLAFLQKKDNGMSLGEFLVRKGYITPKHYQVIQKHIRQAKPPQEAAAESGEELLGTATLAGPSGGAVLSGEAARGGKVITARELEAKDYSSLAGQGIDAYLKETRRVGASDLHFQVDAPPFMRLHGEIVYLKHPKLTPEDTAPRIMDVLPDAQRKVFEEHKDVDFCYEADHGRYRAQCCRQRKGIDAVFRVIPNRIPTIEELHLPPIVKKFTDYRHGIVLITGPAGCGKTATMAALIEIINQKRNDHIVTVEEPIEYIIESKRCNVNQRHVSVHTDNFNTALRSAMRADPDYICVGEMRDLETVSMAITAAETGHLVFGTLHTQNATRSVDRIIDVFPPKEQEQIRAMVSESMRGVISQQLLPRADGRGREPATEIMFATSAVRNLIRERKTFQLPSIIQTGSKQGMIGMDDSIRQLLDEKIITRETAIFHAEHPERFKT